MIRPNDFVITEDNYIERCRINETQQAFGLIPRPMESHPVGSYAASRTYGSIRDELPLIPWSDMPERIKELAATKSLLSDYRNVTLNGQPFPALNQGNSNFCWAYASVGAVMMLRASHNLQCVRLSGHAVGCKIKGFRNQGGWSAHSTQFITENGVPSVLTWKEQSFSQANDTSQAWEEAKLFRIVEGWIDVDSPVYDRDLSFQQVLTLLINRVPVPSDFNWWGHAVVAIDPVDVYPSKPANDPSRYGVRILNSWSDSYGERGTAVLTGKKAVPDNAVGPRAVVFS